MHELDRAMARYRERDASQGLTGFWTLRNPAVLHVAQERERVVLEALTTAGVELQGAKVLDVGCGLGLEFANLMRWGARRNDLFGIDLMHERLRAATELSGVALAQASSAALPFADASFDLVCQNVVFSSIMDAELRSQTAAEMLRVLRPGGHLLWYDACRSATTDRHFRAVPRAEIEALFPGLNWRFRSLTSHVGIARRMARWLGAWSLGWLDASALARTHLLGLARKP